MTTRNALRKVERLSAAAAAELEKSGITEAQAIALGMYSVDNAFTVDKGFDGVPGLVIPYFDAAGRPMRGHPTWPDFFRLRYLKEVKDFGDVSGKKLKRYVQPGGSAVHAYLANCTDWKAIQNDPTEPVLITEGEKKAAKACLEGFPTVGLGGVHSYRSSKTGVFWLPELEAFNWARRRVTIAYDSDYAQNPNICEAINKLGEELQERGALVDLISLPNVYDDGRKTGLDDLLVEKGDEALIKLLKEADALGVTAQLWNMNAEVVYVQDPGLIVSQTTRQKFSPQHFTNHSDWATASTPERQVRSNGSLSYEKMPAAPIWIKWPLRKRVDKITYLPGQEAFVVEKGRDYFNQWQGWGVEPKKGDVKPWLELIEFLFLGADKGAKDWFLDWCAYPLQNPGTKLFSACLLYGRKTGTGKTLAFYTLGKIYGDNFTKIKNKDLHDTWWAENKQFILGDEISGTDKRAEADSLKTIITQEEVNINIKFVPQFQVRDCINYGFTSNHADAFFLEDEDRRFFIQEVLADTPMPLEFYREYERWKEGGGPAALFHHLLQRDLSKFNPKGPAFQTTARDRMIVGGKSDLAGWCHELSRSPDTKLFFGQMRYVKDLFTSKELLDMYNREHASESKVTANGMARALAAAGFRLAYKGMPIATKTGQGRYFIIRNYDKWNTVTQVKDLARHVELTPVKS